MEIKAYITNLEQYTNGYLNGEWVTFPVEDNELKQVCDRIGIREGHEYFITDYENNYFGFGEYTPVSEINKVTNLVEEINDDDLVKAICQYWAIDELENYENWKLYPEITTQQELGEYLVNEVGLINLDEEIAMYFDYEKYGRDYEITSGGVFTNYGWLQK